jgi:hypothetical protein
MPTSTQPRWTVSGTGTYLSTSNLPPPPPSPPRPLPSPSSSAHWYRRDGEHQVTALPTGLHLPTCFCLPHFPSPWPGEAMLSTLILTLGFSPDEERRRLCNITVATLVVRRFLRLWRVQRASEEWPVRVLQRHARVHQRWGPGEGVGTGRSRWLCGARGQCVRSPFPADLNCTDAAFVPFSHTPPLFCVI